jgi:hypothetical protein
VERVLRVGWASDHVLIALGGVHGLAPDRVCSNHSLGRDSTARKGEERILERMKRDLSLSATKEVSDGYAAVKWVVC